MNGWVNLRSTEMHLSVHPQIMGTDVGRPVDLVVKRLGRNINCLCFLNKK